MVCITRNFSEPQNLRFIIESGFKSRAGYNGGCTVFVFLLVDLMPKLGLQTKARQKLSKLMPNLGTIQILRKQNSGWVGVPKCLRLLTWWVGGDSKMLT